MTSARTERVLVVEPSRAVAERAVRAIVASGGEAVLVTSAAEALHVEGRFDRGMFAIDLPDGSGVVLAAELWVEDRVNTVSFFDPIEGGTPLEEERRPGLRATRAALTANADTPRVA